MPFGSPAKLDLTKLSLVIMSKIGNKPIDLTPAVQVQIEGNTVTIKGREGELNFQIPKVLSLIKEVDKIYLKRKNEEKKTKSLHGLFRQIIFNAIKGVEIPWQRKLEIVGTGFNVKLQGEELIFKIGYSHPVIFKKVQGIKFQVEGSNKIIVSGSNKELVGQVAYRIKILKKPDVYKGKGIRYQGEILKLKPGKKVKTVTAGSA